MPRTLLLIAVPLALAGCGGPPAAPAPAGPVAAAAPPPAGARPASGSDVTAFRGAPAASGALGLRTFGFEPAGRRAGAERWENRATGACAEVVSEGGRFTSVVMLPAGTC